MHWTNLPGVKWVSRAAGDEEAHRHEAQGETVHAVAGSLQDAEIRQGFHPLLEKDQPHKDPVAALRCQMLPQGQKRSWSWGNQWQKQEKRADPSPWAG